MKRGKRVLSLLLAGALTVGCFPGSVMAENNALDGTKPADGTTVSQPFPGNLFLSEHNSTDGFTRFRIPALVATSDGDLVASCDIRWDYCDDGAGLDTIVSRTEDGGKNWNYSVINYLGDNGNTKNKMSASFIDTALAVDGNTIYMAYDVDPAGISLSTYHSTYVAQSGSTGFNEQGQLLLAESTDTVSGKSDSTARAAATFEYHLEKVENAGEDDKNYYQIVKSDGTVVEDYMVDADFNIQSTTGNVNTNLFCGDTPFFTYPAPFIGIKKSTDGGKTWSKPMLIDVKLQNEKAILVAPGRGIVVEHEGSKDNKRIIFACYGVVGSTEGSGIFYSDDGGETWQRGMKEKENCSLSRPSSEVALTEADGRVYMFVRHQNKYAVSNDGGDTWSDLKDTGISYLSTCELSAYTYSKKINGKTAILLSAPLGERRGLNGNASYDRFKGRIFVGLVDESTGNIEWMDSPYVVTDGHYAYTSMTETKDGQIALLYESDERKITFKTFEIEDIVKNAVIGNIWMTDENQKVVYQDTIMKPDQTLIYTVNTTSEHSNIQVTSQDPSVLTAVYENGKVILNAQSGVTGFQQVKVTVTADDQSYTWNVHVTNSEKYEVVNLGVGEIKTFTEQNGAYTEIDNSIFDTLNEEGIVTGAFGNTYVKTYAKAATATGVFEGGLFDLDRCLYTFTGGTDHIYQMKATSLNNGEVYLAIKSASSAGMPYQTSAKNILIGQRDDGYFYFQEQNASGGAGNTLVFTGNHVFDRQGSVDETACFELYKQAVGNTKGSAVIGYSKITSLDDLHANEKYLIVTKADANGDQYVLVPFNGNSRKNEFTAKLVNIQTTGEETQVKVGSSVSSEENGVVQFEGINRPISDCLYTFNMDDGNSTAGSFLANDENGNPVYLNFNQLSSSKLVNQSNRGGIRISEAGNGTFRFNQSGTEIYLGLDNTLSLYQCGSSDSQGLFEIYTPSEDSEGWAFPGYKKLQSISELKHNSSYLFVRVMVNGSTVSRYIVNPTSATAGDYYSQVGLVTNESVSRTDVNAVKTLSFTGETSGSTSVQIGDTTYYITVTGSKDVETSNLVSIESEQWNPVEDGSYWYDMKFADATVVDGIRILPETLAASGKVTAYEVWVSNQESLTSSNWQDDFVKVCDGTWNATELSVWKTTKFEPVEATHVRVVATQVTANADQSAIVAKKQALHTIITESEQLQKHLYLSGWNQFTEALGNAREKLESVDLAKLTSAYNTLKNAKSELVAIPSDYKYDSNNRFQFPTEAGQGVVLEAEFAKEFVNSTESDSNPSFDMTVTSANWASNGKFVNGMAYKDYAYYDYTAEAGTYRVIGLYRSGSSSNKIKFSESNGNITDTTASCVDTRDANNVLQTAVFECDLTVTTAGQGTLVLTAPDTNEAPQLDKLYIIRKSSEGEPLITATADEHGSISADGMENGKVSVTSGESVSVEITPEKGYIVSDVIVDGSSVGGVNSYTFNNVTGSHTIQASFQKMQVECKVTVAEEHTYFHGGALRVDDATDYSKASMRYEYQFPTELNGMELQDNEWLWYYSTSLTNGKISQDLTRKVEKDHFNKVDGICYSNLVFTNIKSENYISDVYAQLVIPYANADQSETLNVYTAIADRTVEWIATRVKESDTVDANKEYAQEILNRIPKSYVALGSTNAFSDSQALVDECLYTFTKTGENTYQISSTTADGRKVYLGPAYGSAASQVNKDSAANGPGMKLYNKVSSDSGLFSFEDTKTNANGRWLYFHRDGDAKFNRNSSYASNYCDFRIYQKTNVITDDQIIKGYIPVSGLSAIQDGGQYLIVSEGMGSNSGNYYLLHPAIGGQNWNHVAKLINQ